MTNAWMVRAGEGGYLADEFFERGFISIGWNDVGDLTSAATADDVRAAYTKAYPGAKPGEIGNAVAMIQKFRLVLKPSDHVVSYDPSRREYLVGKIVGDYTFKPGEIKDHSNLRKVEWIGRVLRDRLSVPSRNTLGSTLALFSLPVDVWNDIWAKLRSDTPPQGTTAERVEEEKEGIEESGRTLRSGPTSSSRTSCCSWMIAKWSD